MSKQNKDQESIWGDIVQSDVRPLGFWWLLENRDKIVNNANSPAMRWGELTSTGAWKENPWGASTSVSVHKHKDDVLRIALEAAQ